jgi:hypothetical protein
MLIINEIKIGEDNRTHLQQLTSSKEIPKREGSTLIVDRDRFEIRESKKEVLQKGL